MYIIIIESLFVKMNKEFYHIFSPAIKTPCSKPYIDDEKNRSTESETYTAARFFVILPAREIVDKEW